MGQLNLDLERRRRLLWSDDPAIRSRAEALFADAGVVTRAEVLAQLKPAIQLTGNPENGHLHYQNLCAQCHTMGTVGFAVGPDLTEISRKGAETLLSDLFDPNAAVNTEYLGYTIDDEEGDVFTGIVTLETEALVTLRQSGGQDLVIPRARITSMSSSGLSLMPEGLEIGLSLQDVADLLSFLQLPK
jgi:putative heme-binding domain-containing protein